MLERLRNVEGRHTAATHTLVVSCLLPKRPCVMISMQSSYSTACAACMHGEALSNALQMTPQTWAPAAD